MSRWSVTVPVYAFVTVEVELPDDIDDEDAEYEATEHADVANAIRAIERDAMGDLVAPRGVHLAWGGSDSAVYEKATAEKVKP